MPCCAKKRKEPSKKPPTRPQSRVARSGQDANKTQKRRSKIAQSKKGPSSSRGSKSKSFRERLAKMKRGSKKKSDRAKAAVKPKVNSSPAKPEESSTSKAKSDASKKDGQKDSKRDSRRASKREHQKPGKKDGLKKSPKRSKPKDESAKSPNRSESTSKAKSDASKKDGQKDSKRDSRRASKREHQKPGKKDGLKKSPKRSKPKDESAKSPNRSEREIPKRSNGIPAPGDTCDTSLIPSQAQPTDSVKEFSAPPPDENGPHPPAFVYGALADPAHAQQQLIVSSFVSEGRRVKRWTYADSYPAGEVPPSLGALLMARPPCGRDDCELSSIMTICESLPQPQKTQPQTTKNERLPKKVPKCFAKPLNSNAGLRRPGEITRCESVTSSQTLLEDNARKAPAKAPQLSAEAVEKLLEESRLKLHQAALKIKQIRHREKDDSLYTGALDRVEAYEKKVQLLARAVSSTAQSK